MRYKGKYSCGHEGVVELHGKVDKHPYQIEKHFSSVCPDCLKDQKEFNKKKAHFLANRLGLIELRGTKKQVEWANTIRIDILEKVIKVIETTDDVNKKELFLDVENYLMKQGDASWWIEHRSYGMELLVKTVQSLLQAEKDKLDHIDMVKEVVLTAKDLQKSKGLVSTGEESRKTVVIKVNGSLIKVESTLDQDLINLVKSMYFEWKEAPYLGEGRYYDTPKGVKPKYAWYRKIKEEGAGSVEDRVAELGYRLIQLGFPVVIHSDIIRGMVITGDFKPEYRQWMTTSTINKRVSLKWLKHYGESHTNWRLRSNEIYKRLNSFYGAKWNKETQSMEVPVKYYKELLDIADEYGFKVCEDVEYLFKKCKNEDI